MKTRTYQFDLGIYSGFVLNDHSGFHTADELIVNPNLSELEHLRQEFKFE